jgi:ParB/RepB/Spo0J family partition protein
MFERLPSLAPRAWRTAPARFRTESAQARTESMSCCSRPHGSGQAISVPRPRRCPAEPVRSPSAALPTPAAEVRRIPIGQIDVPPGRIRRELGSVQDLAHSLGCVGLLHPVLVYCVRNRSRLIAGERRLEAARMLGCTEMDAMLRQPSPDHLLLELIENTQRKWLTDIEEADAIIRLIRELGHGGREVAAQAGRSDAYVSKRMRVFEDASLGEAVERDQLSVSVVEECLALPAADERALSALLEPMLGLARAHAGPGRSAMVLPTMEEADVRSAAADACVGASHTPSTAR